MLGKKGLKQEFLPTDCMKSGSGPLARGSEWYFLQSFSLLRKNEKRSLIFDF